MGYKMSHSEHVQYLNKFKKFYLELLYFYWQLSDDNPYIKQLEYKTGMSLSVYSRTIARQEMTIPLMQDCVDIIRGVLGLAIKSEVTVVQPRVIEVTFNLFLIREE